MITTRTTSVYDSPIMSQALGQVLYGNSTTILEVLGVPILQTKKPRHGDGKYLAQDYTEKKSRSLDEDSGPSRCRQTSVLSAEPSVTHLEPSTACGWENQQGPKVSVSVGENISLLAPDRVLHRKRILFAERMSPGECASSCQDGGEARHSILIKS